MEDNDEVARLQTRLNALKQESMEMLQEEQRLKIIQKELELQRLNEEMESQAARALRKQRRLEREERRKEMFGDEQNTTANSSYSSTNNNTTTEGANRYTDSSPLNSSLPADEPRCPPLTHHFTAHPTRAIIYCVKCGRIENLS
jgi:hypothetical protein